MSRVAALDIGDARIGVAASDELGITVSPVTTFVRGRSIKTDVRAMCVLLEQLGASTVVVGLPLDNESQEGLQAVKVKEFVTRLARQAKASVVTWDERFSTQEAEEMLIEANASRAKRRRVIDQAAAAVILRSYLRSLE